VKAHLGRITEDTPEHQGVVVFNMSDIPLVRSYTPFRLQFYIMSQRVLVSPHGPQ
jgi:hypothetical protein